MQTLRHRKPSESSRPELEAEQKKTQNDEESEKGEGIESKKNGRSKEWSCIDNCCWFIGLICSIWWFLLFLYNAMPSYIPQYVTEAIAGPMSDPPGEKLRKEGFTAQHPVVFVPGIVTGGLELWEGKPCAEGLFRKRLWGGTFGEVYKRL